MSEPFAFGGRSVRVIDLSQALSNTTTAFEPMPHEIEYLDHRATSRSPRRSSGWAPSTGARGSCGPTSA